MMVLSSYVTVQTHMQFLPERQSRLGAHTMWARLVQPCLDHTTVITLSLASGARHTHEAVQRPHAYYLHESSGLITSSSLVCIGRAVTAARVANKARRCAGRGSAAGRIVSRHCTRLQSRRFQLESVMTMIVFPSETAVTG